MSALGNIEALVAPALAAMGYNVVRIQLSGQQRKRLQVMIERSDRRAIVVDDCAEVSRALSAILDVEDPIPGAYTLEVSSPGIDRPLVRADDFERFAGFAARVELGRPLDGRRRFTGRIVGVKDGQVRLRLESEEDVGLPVTDILRAKLVLTDDLIAAHDKDASGPLNRSLGSRNGQ
ncbi:MAG: ribosome maturation factor RimP [Rhodospirillales bacterium]|nr:ribosome maturation factor RimP [Rhodospirillales bacterium]